MKKILNPSNEQKEFYLNRIPDVCRTKFMIVCEKPSGNRLHPVDNIFAIHNGDKFIRLDPHFGYGSNTKLPKHIYEAESEPFIDEYGNPVIKCKEVH